MPHPLVLAPPSAITPQSNPFDPDDPSPTPSGAGSSCATARSTLRR
jgi:hypothetical protein